MEKSDLGALTLFLIVTFVIIGWWFATFALALTFDLTDVIFEGAALLAAIFGFTFILKLRLRPLTLGWMLFSITLLLNLLEEFTRTPELWHSIIPNLALISGLLAISIGLYFAERERRERIAQTRAHEAQLQKSRAQFQDLYENATDAIFTIDPQGHFQSANRAALDLFGYAAADLLQKNIADVLTPESLEHALPLLARAIETQSNLAELQPWEYTVRDRAGNLIVIEVRTRLMREEGNLIGLQGIARDVTVRRRTEENLRRRDAILQAFNFAAEQLLKTTDWTASINAMLAQLGQAASVSRVYIFENYTDASGKTLSNQRYEWVAPGITPQIDNSELPGFDFVAVGFARWLDLMSAGKPVYGRVCDMSSGEQTVLAAEAIQSILCVPIFVENTWWGFIGFDDCLAAREWNTAEIDALTTAANTLGAAFERARLQAQVQARLDEQSLLLGLSQDLLAIADLQAIYARVLQTIAEMLPLDLAHIWMVDESGERGRVVAQIGWGDDHLNKIAFALTDPAAGGIGWAIRNHQVVITPDVAQETRFTIVPIVIARGIQSAIAAPMLAGERAIGAIAAHRLTPCSYTEDHARLLSMIANIAAQAIERARLFDAEMQRARHLELLNDITQIAIGATNFTQLAQTTVDRFRELFQADGCHISLWNAHTEQTTLIAASGPWREKLAELAIAPGDLTLTATALQQGRALAAEDIAQTPFLSASIKAQISAASMLSLPMIADDQKIGAITLAYDQPRHFTDHEITRAEQAAAQAALALAKTDLYDQARARLARVSALHEIDLAITSTLSLDERLVIVLDHTIAQLRGDIATVFLLKNDQLNAVAQRGAPCAANFPIGIGTVGWIAQTGETLAIPNVHTDARWVETEDARAEGITSYLGVPLCAGNRVIGVLDVCTRARRAFTVEEIDFLVTLAGQAAIAIENARLFEETQRRARELAALYETTRDLATQRDRAILLQTIVERATNLLNARAGGMYICDPERRQVQCVVSYNTLRDYTGTILKYGEGAAGTVAASGIPLIIDDYREWNKRATTYEEDRPFSAVLSVPIFWQGQVTGVLHVLDDCATRHFTSDDIRLLTPFADQAATAIENARLFEETQQRAREFAGLYDTVRDLASQRDLNKLLQTIVDRAATLLDTAHGGFYLYDAARDGLALAAVTQSTPGEIVRAWISVSEGLMGQVAVQRSPLIVNNYQTWEHRLPDLAAIGLSAVVQVPLLYAGELIGVLDVHEIGDSSRQFTPNDVRLLSLFATQAASAIYNARLFGETQQRAREFGALYDTARDLSTARDLPAVLRAIAERAAALLAAAVGSVYLIDPAHGDLELVFTKDEFAHLIGTRLKIGEGLAGKVAQTRAPLIVENYQTWEGHAAKFDAIPIRAVAAMPMVYAGDLIGVLIVHELDASMRQFTDADARLLALFATQAASAVRNAQLFAQTQRRADHLAAINRVARSVSASLDLDHTLEIIFHETTQVLPADVFFIALYDAAKQELDFRVRVDEGKREPPTRAPIGDNLTSYVIREHTALLIRDWEREKDQLPPTRLFGTMQAAQSWIGAPMQIGNRVIGVISVQAYRPNVYDIEEQQLLMTIADQAAIAIENARLFEETTHRAQQLETLYQVGQAINSTLDTETILETVTAEAMRVTGATHGCLCIADTQANQFVYRALRSFTPELIAQFHTINLPLDHGLNGRAYQTQQIISVDDVRASPDYVEFVPATRAELIAPIVRGDAVLGNIDLQSPQVGAFREANLALLRALANQAGIALENARLFEQAQRRGHEQTIVSDVIRALNASLDARQAFPAIVQGVRALTQCDRVSMALLDETNEHFVIAALDAPHEELSQGTRMPVSATAAANDVLAGRVHLTPDLQIEAHFPAEHTLWQAGYHSRINIPLVVGEWVIGALNLVSRQVNGFSLADLPTLRQIGDAIAIAIENMHLFESEQTRREELAALYDLSRTLGDLNDRDGILNLVAQRAVTTMHVTFARLAMIEDEQLVVRAAHPARMLGRDLRLGQRQPLTSLPIYSELLATTTPLLFSINDPRLTELEREILFLSITKVLCLVPLRVGERILGVLMIGEVRDERREPFTEEKVRLARSIGDQTASALHRAELFAQIESAFLQTVLALAQATDAKDTYTANHAQRLADMSVRIGAELGLNVRELEDLRYGATLHDIGKIGISDTILQKAGALTPEEWTQMRRHPIIGEQILAPVPRLAGAAKIVRHHHERFDGSGYPDRLAGEAIPLGARILTVVDSYSAIVDRRVYKQPRSHRQAITELKHHIGAQFDPHIMEIFLRLFAQSSDGKTETE